MNKRVEAEGSELVIRNENGDYAIIPKAKRKEVIKAIEDDCHDCVDSIVRSLPLMSDYAEDGTLIPDVEQQQSQFVNPEVQDVQTNRMESKPSVPSEDSSNKPPTKDKDIEYTGSLSLDAPGTLPVVNIEAKRQYKYKGCVTGLCRAMAEENKMSYEKFRKLNNLYGDAWEVNNTSYGKNIDVSSYNNLKIGDVVNLTRDAFASDRSRNIPGRNQHIGYVSKIENGIPYIKHYINEGKYGQYYEEPINNISKKFNYRATGARRIDHYKEIETLPSTFKFSPNYEPNDIEKEFLRMNDEKADVQKKLRLSNDEYEELYRVAYGIMGNESSFGRSKKTLYRMAVPDFVQKLVKKGVDVIKGTNNYDENINNLSQGYSSSKESSLHGVSVNDGSSDYLELNRKIKSGDTKGIERTNNYLYYAFNDLGLNPDNLEQGTNSAKAIMATLAWYRKRNPDATVEDLLKKYTGKKNITKYKESFDKYMQNIDDDPNNNLTYTGRQNAYGKMSHFVNNANEALKFGRDVGVSIIRDMSPLPAQYDALIADVLQGKSPITNNTLTPSNIKRLTEIVKNNVLNDKFTIDYDDYSTAEDAYADIGASKNAEGPLKTLGKSFTDDSYILKTLLGQATIKKIDDHTYEVIDTFDFNDQGKSFGIFDDLRKRGLSPYSLARSVGRNYGSGDNQGAIVKIRIKI